MSTHNLAQPSPPELPNLDLDARIQQAEMLLMAREFRLRRGIDAARLSVHRSLQPWRRAMPAAAVALGISSLGGLWLKWQRRARRILPAQPPAPAAAGPAQEGGIPWVRLVALGWPLLPQAWRSRLSPATASTLVALGLPALEWLLRGRRPAPPATHPAVDLSRFAGTWHVLAQLPRRFGPRHDGQATLRFLPRHDGQLDVVWSRERGAQVDVTHGLARVVPGSGAARLQLSLWPAWLRGLPQAWDEHWILHLDEPYAEALVGSPDRDRLLVLARQPLLAAQRLTDLLQRARQRGFAVERLEFAGPGLGPSPA